MYSLLFDMAFKQQPIPVLDASVSKINVSEAAGDRKISGLLNCFFTYSKEVCHSAHQVKLTSFLRRLYNGAILSLNLGMNRLQYCDIPMNRRKDLTS